jgi:hypothetical protein
MNNANYHAKTGLDLVFEVPDHMMGTARSTYGAISLYGHAPQIQVPAGVFRYLSSYSVRSSTPDLVDKFHETRAIPDLERSTEFVL